MVICLCESEQKCARACVSLLGDYWREKLAVTKTQVHIIGVGYGEKDELVLSPSVRARVLVCVFQRERAGGGRRSKNSLWLFGEYSPHAPLSGAGLRLCRACSRLCDEDSDKRKSAEEPEPGTHHPAAVPL